MGIEQAKEIMDRVVLLALRQCQALDDVKAILAAWDIVKAGNDGSFPEEAPND